MGEYEPNDSRNVTGANQSGQAGASGAPGGDAPISQSPQQGHGQDPGMRSQMSGQGHDGQNGDGQSGGGQQQQFGSDGGQMGGGQMGSGQMDGGEAHARADSGDHPLADQIREHMEVIGADGVHVGTVDHVDGDRIKLTKRDSGAGYEGGTHTGHHHYLSIGLVAGIEGDTVRLSANGDVAYGMEEEEGDEQARAKDA